MRRRHPGCVKAHDYVGRRDFLLTAGSGLGALLLSGTRAPASPDERSPEFQTAFDKLTHGAVPIKDKITLDIDDYVENGHMAFFRLSVANPMTEDDYVETVHLLSTANPVALVATFHLTELSARAAVAGRMRLAKSQDVVALAALSGNRLVMAERYVKVGIGGCGI